MTPRRDDDALSWDGDDDPTLDVGATPDAGASAAESTVLPAGYTAVGKGSDALEAQPVVAGSAAPAVDEDRTGMSNAALVGLGIFGGVYLLLTLGWLLGASRLQLVAQLFLDPVAFHITLWLAVAALPLWFVTVLWLTRTSAGWVRFMLLAAGAVLLIPWPFVLAGAAL